MLIIFVGPMIRLALPGLLMVEAEFLAFEILTLASSYFSTTHLAAQSILSTLTALTFQIPFPISIAASTRVANLIGATLADAAKTSAKVVSWGCTTTIASILIYDPGLLCCRHCRNVQCGPAFLAP
jgi:MATE family multidrug resistance protein